MAEREERGRRSSHDATQVGKKKQTSPARASRSNVGSRSNAASDVGTAPRSHSRATEKKAGHHVRYADTQQGPESHIGPSKIMRSASSLGVKAGSKQERQKRNQQVAAAMATFSAVDLAPPAPKSKRKVDEHNAYLDSDQEVSSDEGEPYIDDARSATGTRALPTSAVPGPSSSNHVTKHVPPQSGYSKSDVSDTEAEADSDRDGEDSLRDSMTRAGDRTMEDQPPMEGHSRPEVARDSRTSSPSEMARPALRLARYNEHGELTPPGSDTGGRANAHTQTNMSHAEMASYDAASPWTVPGPSHAATSTNLSRPESRASLRSNAGVFDRLLNRTGGEQVSRKYALSPPLSPLGSDSREDLRPVSFGTGAEIANEQFGRTRPLENADASRYDQDQDRHQMQQREAPSTPVPNATLAPPTFALQPPTPQQDLTHTPFHDVEQPAIITSEAPSQKQLFTTSEGRANYQLPNGTVLGAPVGGSEVRRTEQGSSERPGSLPSSRSSSHSTKSVHNSRQAGQPSRQYPASTISHMPQQRSASPTPPQSTAPSSSSDRPPAPPNPHQPAFLKWDPANQRWIPVPTLANNSLPPPRPESVVSSASAYSQMSAPKPVSLPMSASQARRQSLPTLALSPSRSTRRAPSPAMSSYSRPASPSKGPILASPIPGTSFSNRRMSIDPPYLMNPNTLTLLPEMHEVDSTPKDMPLSPRSAPHSRAPSIDGRASVSGYGYRSSFSSHRPRDGMSFPTGYDVNARAVDMTRGGSGSRASSVNGDFISEGESRWHTHYTNSRDPSLYQEDIPYEESEYDGETHVARSTFGESAAPSAYGGKPKASVKPGKESVLDVMSVQGDSVQLLGSDGTEQPASGYTLVDLAKSDMTRRTLLILPRVALLFFLQEHTCRLTLQSPQTSLIIACLACLMRRCLPSPCPPVRF